MSLHYYVRQHDTVPPSAPPHQFLIKAQCHHLHDTSLTCTTCATCIACTTSIMYTTIMRCRRSNASTYTCVPPLRADILPTCSNDQQATTPPSSVPYAMTMYPRTLTRCLHAGTSKLHLNCIVFSTYSRFPCISCPCL
jgi:hypothetical protein